MRLESLAGDRRQDFLAEVFAAERPCVTGGEDFAVALARVLERWQCDANVEDVLDLWTLIEPDAGILSLVADLRDRGCQVCLATNQQRHRARYMADVLGYDRLFDQSFYSCEVGLAKPERGYFIEVVERLGLKSYEILFVDDNDFNVAAARQIGLNAEQFHLMEGVDVLRERMRLYDIEV